jgi:hypothetical protein
MPMSYAQFIKNTDVDQKRQIEVERVQSALLNELSFMDYEANEDIKEKLYNIAEQLVNEKSKARGFRNMSLAQLCEAYERNV